MTLATAMLYQLKSSNYEREFDILYDFLILAIIALSFSL